jgi:hypothetical protein
MLRLDALDELLRVLVMGLRNRLVRHHERDAPFLLTQRRCSGD